MNSTSGLLAWSPLANGVLTGKYQGKDSGHAGRMAKAEMKEFLPEEQRATRIISAVKSVSGQVGRSMARVSLAWLRYRPLPVIPLIGARRVLQLQDNLESLDLELSAEQLKSLDDASRIDVGFPYDLYSKEMIRASAYGGLRDRLVA